MIFIIFKFYKDLLKGIKYTHYELASYTLEVLI